MDVSRRSNHSVEALLEKSKTLTEENENLKKEVEEKHDTILSMEQRIKELEVKVSMFDTFKAEFANKLSSNDKNCKDMNDLMSNYERSMTKIIQDRDLNLKEKQRACKHLEYLEAAFRELLNKFEQAKVVIAGLEHNEATLKNQIQLYRNVLEEMQEKYNQFKQNAISKLNEANAVLLRNDKEYISETMKLKAKIVQSQQKINDLEKACSKTKVTPSLLTNTLPVNGSIFEPLVTKFK